MHLTFIISMEKSNHIDVFEKAIKTFHNSSPFVITPEQFEAVQELVNPDRLNEFIESEKFYNNDKQLLYTLFTRLNFTAMYKDMNEVKSFYKINSAFRIFCEQLYASGCNKNFIANKNKFFTMNKMHTDLLMTLMHELGHFTLLNKNPDTVALGLKVKKFSDKKNLLFDAEISSVYYLKEHNILFDLIHNTEKSAINSLLNSLGGNVNQELCKLFLYGNHFDPDLDNKLQEGFLSLEHGALGDYKQIVGLWQNTFPAYISMSPFLKHILKEKTYLLYQKNPWQNQILQDTRDICFKKGLIDSAIILNEHFQKNFIFSAIIMRHLYKLYFCGNKGNECCHHKALLSEEKNINSAKKVYLNKNNDIYDTGIWNQVNNLMILDSQKMECVLDNNHKNKPFYQQKLLFAENKKIPSCYQAQEEANKLETLQDYITHYLHELSVNKESKRLKYQFPFYTETLKALKNEMKAKELQPNFLIDELIKCLK